MKTIAVGFVMLCECAFAQCDYSMVLTNMVNALNRPSGTLDVVLTNSLAVSARTMTNVNQAANVNLVRAIALADIAEHEVCADLLLPQAIAICSNLITSAELRENAWQRKAAGLVLTGIYSFCGTNFMAHQCAVNSMRLVANSVSAEEDILLWNAIAGHLKVEGLSLHDALRCYAAVSILACDSVHDVSSYTNGLPDSAIVKIRELVE